jgi:ketosteroid isomerase-like protein
MVNDLYTIPSETDTKQVVLSFLNAVNNEDFKAARRYVTNDMKFNGVLGSRDGAEDYFEGMEKLKFKFDVKKVFVDDNDV